MFLRTWRLISEVAQPKHIEAKPETVFAYFVEPAHYVQWMGPDATLEAVPGGTYRIVMRGGVAAGGTFLEVEPPRRVVFTWGRTNTDTMPPGSTRVVSGRRSPRSRSASSPPRLTEHLNPNDR